MTLRADCQVRRLDTSKEGESSGKTTETAIDWSVAFQSTEFRCGLADIVAQAVVQVNQPQSGQIAGQPDLGHINALERIGDAIPGTGVERRLGLEEGASTSTTKVRQSMCTAPSFMGIVESASTAPGVDQTNQHTEFYNNPMIEGEAGSFEHYD